MSSLCQDILTESEILKYCLPYFSKQIPHICVLKSIDSTNQYLKHLPFSEKLELCCADEQTQGRGRLGRQWYSPAGKNIYCSMRWRIRHPLSKLPALSLIVALAILKSFNILLNPEQTRLRGNLKPSTSPQHPLIHPSGTLGDIKIKWPNDIYWHGKKLGGILIESSSELRDSHLIVVGVGLNINVQSSLELVQKTIDKPWCSLLDITGKTWNRSQIMGILLKTVDQYLKIYLSEGFTPFRSDWEKVDGLYGQSVQVSLSDNRYLTGIASGINDEGALKILDADGRLHLICSGEVTQFSTSLSKI